MIGYPIAYGMARFGRAWQRVAMMLVLVPSGLHFDRIYAWIKILPARRPAQQDPARLHLSRTPVVWASPPTVRCISHRLLLSAFMILPLYCSLAKDRAALMEAASDSSAARRAGVLVVTFRCRLPGRRRSPAVLPSHRR